MHGLVFHAGWQPGGRSVWDTKTAVRTAHFQTEMEKEHIYGWDLFYLWSIDFLNFFLLLLFLAEPFQVNPTGREKYVNNHLHVSSSMIRLWLIMDIIYRDLFGVCFSVASAVFLTFLSCWRWTLDPLLGFFFTPHCLCRGKFQSNTKYLAVYQKMTVIDNNLVTAQEKRCTVTRNWLYNWCLTYINPPPPFLKLI